MQKWEYLKLGYEAIRENDETVAYCAVNGKLIKPHTQDLIKVANDLGEQGWEMVTSNFYFKRPKH
jgi:hypothetical protein